MKQITSAPKQTKNPKTNKEKSRENLLDEQLPHEVSLKPTSKRNEDLGKHNVSEGHNYKEEDAMVKPHFVQEILVT